MIGLEADVAKFPVFLSNVLNVISMFAGKFYKKSF